MALTIGSNVSALQALRQLDGVSRASSHVSERLSSGLRIVRASDDAAGLSISATLDADRAIYTQAVRNVNDGISYLSVMDGALGELQSVVTRLGELANQSSNGTLSNTQRRALQTEAQNLSSEFDRIINTTSFNGQSLFSQSSLDLYAGTSTLSISTAASIYTGDGTFRARVSLSGAGSDLGGLALGDINRDGYDDIVSVDSVANTMFYRLSNGDGTHQRAVTYAATGGASRTALGDFNNDGVLDIVVSDNGTSNKMLLYLGNGDATFQAATTSSVAGFAGYDTPTLADFNKDGNLDAFIGPRIILGNGDGTFRASMFAANGANEPIAFDANSDGNLDLISVSGDELDIYIGNGDGTFRARTTIEKAAGNDVSITSADYNNDGFGDIALINQSPNFVAVYLGNGDGTFRGSATFGTGAYPSGVLSGDFNGDGFEDLITEDTNDRAVSLFLGNGDGTFLSRTSWTIDVEDTNGPIQVGDVNGDGVLDIVSASANWNTLHVLVGNAGFASRSMMSQRIFKDIDLSTLYGARKAIDYIDRLRDVVSANRGAVGSALSRSESATVLSQLFATTSAEAASRIRDADVA